MAINRDPANELQWVKEGRVFQARHGELTTPQAFEIDIVRITADLLVRTPPGVVIVPLRTTVVTEATGGEVFQCVISASDNDIGTANVTAFTPVNQNTRFAAVNSKVTSHFLAGGNNTTAPTNVTDLLRVYVQADIDLINEFAPFEQVVYDPLRGRGIPAVIGSNANVHSFLVYVGNGSSSTGYILTSWAEWSYDEFYAA